MVVYSLNLLYLNAQKQMTNYCYTMYGKVHNDFNLKFCFKGMCPIICYIKFLLQSSIHGINVSSVIYLLRISSNVYTGMNKLSHPNLYKS